MGFVAEASKVKPEGMTDEEFSKELDEQIDGVKDILDKSATTRRGLYGKGVTSETKASLFSKDPS